MKILRIQSSDNRTIRYNPNNNRVTNTVKTASNITAMNHTHDFDVNFRGRTPEDFYKQEFNVRYMPDTMKQYLDVDYETRKFIPPEQIMNESFKYLEVLDNLSDVKKVYPNESLFQNIHDELSIKPRSGILAELNIARQLSEEPLLKDGTNNLGMYLLRKIYLEGKTIKEINKDFYEKDINPEYLGVLSEPIDYSTTSAYGIRYPKTDFWHSFIATRDEYKKFFVTLPKHNKNELKNELASGHKIVQTEQNKEYTPFVPKKITRKYNIKPYQKKQLQKDIIKAKGDEDSVKEVVRKHFSSKDPESSFIMKYISPIMIVAADKIHLSEEERNFAEIQKLKGEQNNRFFAKFWKANPHLLEQYSNAITDTIECFEETYGEGGLIPIDSEYNIITGKNNTKTPIDFVPPEFKELLEYTKTIVPNREQFYENHNRLQKDWDEHFLWRYGDIKEEETTQVVPLAENADIAAKPEKLTNDSVGNTNEKVYLLQSANGNIAHVTANLDETTTTFLERQLVGFPPAFINLFIKKAFNNPLLTEDAKLSLSTYHLKDKFNDPRLLDTDELQFIMDSLISDVQSEISIARMALMDTYADKSKFPHKIFRAFLPSHSTEDMLEYDATVTDIIQTDDIRKELNNRYYTYKQPLSASEMSKIILVIVDYIRNFDEQFAQTEESVLYNSDNKIEFASSLQKIIQKPDKVKRLKDIILSVLPNITYSRNLLETNVPKQVYRARREMVVNNLLNVMTKIYKG